MLQTTPFARISHVCLTQHGETELTGFRQIAVTQHRYSDAIQL